MGDPTITRHDDGTLTVGWPDPPLRTYEVAHEALRFLVDDYNEVVSEVNRLRVQRDRLAHGIRRMAARRCLCHGHSKSPGHGGPCCGVAGGRCVTCEARKLAGDDKEDGQ